MAKGSRSAASDRSANIRATLARLRDEQYVRIRELRAEQEQESEPPVADTLEQAKAAAEIETHAGLIERAEQKLKLFDEAIERAERGTYGICADCGNEIALERLNALPFALYCVNCQSKRRTAAPPGEGEMLEPYNHQWTLPEEMRQPREYRVMTDAARPGGAASAPKKPRRPRPSRS